MKEMAFFKLLKNSPNIILCCRAIKYVVAQTSESGVQVTRPLSRNQRISLIE